MPAKWFVFLIMLLPVALYATPENDMELFEFLAMYEENDNVFIDAEMDDKDNSEQDLTSQKVSKSDPNEY